MLDYVFYYIEAHLACIFLLAIVLFMILKGVNKQITQVYLCHLIVDLVLYFFAEVFWALVDGGVLSSDIKMLYLSNVFTYILISIASYQWFLLSEAIQKDKAVENTPVKWLLSVPVWIMAILCVTAYRTGLPFYVDEAGKIVNGKFYLVLIIVPFAYMIASSIKAFIRAFSRDGYADRNIYLMIGFFPLAPIILGALQAVYWRIPFLCYGAVAAVYYIYISILDNLISIDPLTQMNNRTQMYKYLTLKMRNEEPGMSLFLMIIDVDKFKGINDTYGHIEGDRALVKISDAIKNACQGPRNRFFVSRYGGDEFIVVAEMAYKAEAVWLADQIKNNVRRAAEEGDQKYNLSVSIGIAQYDYNSPITIPAFIARADSDLYKQKKLNAG